MKEEDKSDSENKWNVLITYNNDARDAVQRLEPYGKKAVDKLKTVYDIIGDKTQFSFIADQIITDYQKDTFPHAKEETKPYEHSREDAAGDTVSRRKTSRSVFGIAAILCSVLSLFILPFVLAPVAFILGAVALLKNEKHGVTAIVIAIIAFIVVLYNFFRSGLQTGIM